MSKQLTFYVNKTVNELQKLAFGKLLEQAIDSAELKKKFVAAKSEVHAVSLSRILKGEYGVKRPTAIRLIDAINETAGRELIDKRKGLEVAGYSSDDEDTERTELETMYRKRKNLSPARREAFARILDMVDRELDRLHEEEMRENSISQNGNKNNAST